MLCACRYFEGVDVAYCRDRHALLQQIKTTEAALAAALQVQRGLVVL